jgi:hypothetical protein
VRCVHEARGAINQAINYWPYTESPNVKRFAPWTSIEETTVADDF